LWIGRAPSGEAAYVNRAFRELVGMEAVPGLELEAAPAGYRVFDRDGRPYPTEGLPFVRALAARGPVVVDDMVIHRQDGRRVHIRAQAAPLLDEAGQVGHVAVTFTDISEEVLARKSVERQLAFAVDNAPILLWMHGRDGVVTLSEGAALRSLGFAPGELVGKSVYDLYRDQPQVLRNAERALAGESLSDRYDLPGKVSLQSHIAPVFGPDREVIGVIGVSTDVTESRRLEERLFQSQKMEAVGRLAGGIAHDFNNILGAIQGFACLGHEHLSAFSPARDHLEQILLACARGSTLIKQLLAFSRKQQLRLEVLDAAALVRDLEKMLRRLIGEKIELAVHLTPDPARVHGDAGQLGQVLLNLVANASDAMPEGGAITIEVAPARLTEALGDRELGAPAGNYVMIAVTDSGVGMDEGTRARMFEPFFTTKESGRGTGLGLASVYGIVNHCKGDIAVQSQPGKGTSVRVYLPRVDAALPAIAPSAEPVRDLKGSETVLLVEDDEMVRQLCCEILRRNGYVVLEASNAGEALLICEKHTGELHLLLTDVIMPLVDGVELATRIRRMRPSIRVVFMSGYSANLMAGQRPAGAVLIDKPFKPQILLARIREQLDGV
jgi:PAS domain S-box-containing protein